MLHKYKVGYMDKDDLLVFLCDATNATGAILQLWDTYSITGDVVYVVRDTP